MPETLLIDQFMPHADVSECHGTLVHAPADLVFEVAESLDMASIPIVRAISWLRGKLLGSHAPPPSWPKGLIAGTTALGWRMLARRPALATDEGARRKFRRYWRKAVAGIVLIRWLVLSSIRREAERRYRGGP